MITPPLPKQIANSIANRMGRALLPQVTSNESLAAPALCEVDHDRVGVWSRNENDWIKTFQNVVEAVRSGCDPHLAYTSKVNTIRFVRCSLIEHALH